MASLAVPIENDTASTIQLIGAAVLPSPGDGPVVPNWVTATVTTQEAAADSEQHGRVPAAIPHAGIRVPPHGTMALILTVQPPCPASHRPPAARVVLDYSTPDGQFTQTITDADLPNDTTPWIATLTREACTNT